jgi:hypothetical protein
MLSISPSFLKQVQSVEVNNSSVTIQTQDQTIEISFKFPEDAVKFKELILQTKKVLEGEFLYKIFRVPFPVIKASREKLIRGIVTAYAIEVLRIFQLLGKETEKPLVETLKEKGLKELKELLKTSLKKSTVKSVLLKSNLGPVWIDVRKLERDLGIRLSGTEELIFDSQGVFVLRGIKVYGPYPLNKFEGWILKK